jgi:hypothetical protein
MIGTIMKYWRTQLFLILSFLALPVSACVIDDFIVTIEKEKKSFVGNYFVEIKFSHLQSIEAVEYYLYEDQRDLRFPLELNINEDGLKSARILVDDVAFNNSAINIRLNKTQIECMNIFKLNEIPLVKKIK